MDKEVSEQSIEGEESEIKTLTFHFPGIVYVIPYHGKRPQLTGRLSDDGHFGEIRNERGFLVGRMLLPEPYHLG